ncbi:MAG: DUF4124 domain-containing protein [Thiobacillaceae bacterium]
MRSTLLLISIFALPAQAEELYKCVDAAMDVTYSNIPCRKFPGLKEAKAIDPDVGPEVSETGGPSPGKGDSTQAHVPGLPPRAAAGGKRVLKAERTQKSPCDALSDQISGLMDKMDSARDKAYSAQQESEWDKKIKELNVKKNSLNCF